MPSTDCNLLDVTVKQLMYGFGDVPNPSNDAVGVLEDMLIEYLTDTVRDTTRHLISHTMTSESSRWTIQLIFGTFVDSVYKQLRLLTSVARSMLKTSSLFCERMPRSELVSKNCFT